MSGIEGLREAFDNIMERHPGADGEFFATTKEQAFTRIKISGKIKQEIDEGEPIEGMEEPFYES